MQAEQFYQDKQANKNRERKKLIFYLKLKLGAKSFNKVSSLKLQ